MTRVRRSAVTFDVVRDDVRCERPDKDNTHDNGSGVRAAINNADDLKDTDDRREYEARQ